MGVPGPLRRVLRAVGDQQEHRVIGDAGYQLGNEFGGRRIDPVGVLDHAQNRSPFCQMQHLVVEHLHRSLAQLLGGEIQVPEALLQRQGEQGREQGSHGVIGLADDLQKLIQFGEPFF